MYVTFLVGLVERRMRPTFKTLLALVAVLAFSTLQSTEPTPTSLTKFAIASLVNEASRSIRLQTGNSEANVLPQTMAHTPAPLNTLIIPSNYDSVDVVVLQMSLVTSGVPTSVDPVQMVLSPRILHEGILFRFYSSNHKDTYYNVITEMLVTHQIAGSGALDVFAPNIDDMQEAPSNIQNISKRFQNITDGAMTEVNMYDNVNVSSPMFADRYTYGFLIDTLNRSETEALWNDTVMHASELNGMLYKPVSVNLKPKTMSGLEVNRDELIDTLDNPIKSSYTCVTYANKIVKRLILPGGDMPGIFAPKRDYGIWFVESEDDVSIIDTATPDGIKEVYNYYKSVRRLQSSAMPILSLMTNGYVIYAEWNVTATGNISYYRVNTTNEVPYLAFLPYGSAGERVS